MRVVRASEGGWWIRSKENDAYVDNATMKRLTLCDTVLKFYVFYVCVLLVRMSVYRMCAWCLRRTEGSPGAPGLGSQMM